MRGGWGGSEAFGKNSYLSNIFFAESFPKFKLSNSSGLSGCNIPLFCWRRDSHHVIRYHASSSASDNKRTNLVTTCDSPGQNRLPSDVSYTLPSHKNKLQVSELVVCILGRIFLEGGEGGGSVWNVSYQTEGGHSPPDPPSEDKQV